MKVQRNSCSPVGIESSVRNELLPLKTGAGEVGPILDFSLEHSSTWRPKLINAAKHVHGVFIHVDGMAAPRWWLETFSDHL